MDARRVERFVFTKHHERVRAGARCRRPGRPRRGSRRTSTPVPRQHLRRQRRSRPRTCASWRTATTGCRAWSCARRASSPRATTAQRACAGRTTDPNVKVNELLYRRVDIEDVVSRTPAVRWRERRRFVSGATSSARPRRSAPADLQVLRQRRVRASSAPPCSRRSTRSTRPAAGGCSRVPRARLRERARPPRAGLGAAARLPPREARLASRRGLAQRAGQGRRREGLPRRLDRALHHKKSKLK